MSGNSEEPEVELYEEVVGDEYWNSPIRDQTSSVVPVASALAKGTTLHGPTFINDGSRRTVEATETFAHAPRPDPRDYTELAEAPKEVPRYNDGVAATLPSSSLLVDPSIFGRPGPLLYQLVPASTVLAVVCADGPYTLAKKVAYVAKLNVAFWLMYCDVAYMAT